LLPAENWVTSLSSLLSLPDAVLSAVLACLRPCDQLWATSTCKQMYRCIYEVKLTARGPQPELALASLVRALSSRRLKDLETIVLAPHNARACNVVTDAALAALAGAVRSTTIQTLVLRKCARVTDVGIAALAAQCPALRTLDLGGTAATAAGIVAAAAEGKLTSLALRGCAGVNDSVAAALAGPRSLLCPLWRADPDFAVETLRPLVASVAALVDRYRGDKQPRRQTHLHMRKPKRPQQEPHQS
jgi:hypothetical protein